MARLLLGYGCALTTHNTGPHTGEKGEMREAEQRQRGASRSMKGIDKSAGRLFVFLLGPEVGCGEGGGNDDECRGRESHQDQVLVSKYQKQSKGREHQSDDD